MNTKSILLVLTTLTPVIGCATIRPTDPYTHPRPPSAMASRGIDIPSHLPKQPLSLERAIEIALAANPEVAATKWETEAAGARRDIAARERLPSLAVTGGYTHNLDEQRLLPVRKPGDPTVLSRDIVSGDLVLTMPLFTGGRLVSNMRAADLLLESVSHRAERSREELVFNVSSIFYSILSQEHVVEALQFSLKVLQQHLENVDKMVEARKAAEVDRLRTEVRLADITQRLVKEKNLLAVEQRVLANLLGLDGPADSIFITGDLLKNLEEPIPDIEATVSTALQRRRDYLAARAALEAQARYVDAARADYWPTVSLLGSYGERWAIGEISGDGQNPDDIGRLGFSLSIPLFDGGRTRARVSARLAELAASRERLRKLEMQIRLEVESAILGLRSSHERIAAMQKAVDQARESLRIEQHKYGLGKGTIVDVLDAQAALLESETNYYRALTDHHIASAQLKLAEGEEL